MNDQDYIRKAVELADNFNLGNCDTWWIREPTHASVYVYCKWPTHWFLAALAAQLRLQAQADPHIVFEIAVVDFGSYVTMIIYNPDGDEEVTPLRFVANETREAMAFIKAIVDSKVLEKQ